MNYWHELQIAGGMGGFYPWILLATVLVIGFLRALLPSAAGRLRAAGLMAILSLPGLLICASLLQRGVAPADPSYRWLHFASIWFLAVSLISVAGVLIFRLVLPAIRLPAPPILRDTLLGIAYIVVAISLLSRHEVDVSGIIATSAVVTAIIGFSLQDTLGNIMGGIALQMEKSIAVGDWIRLGDLEGRVHEIRWRQTSIETRNWDTVVIPNSVLMKTQVTVIGRRAGKPRRSRVLIHFNVDYRHGPAQVMEILTEALRAHPIHNVATDPPPHCVLTDFKESFATYAVFFWIMDPAIDLPTNSEIRARIYVALQRAGVPLSIPAERVFLTMDNRARRQRKHQMEIDRRVAALESVAVLAPLTDEERRGLAERLTHAPFHKGEVMTRQGSVSHHLFIIVRGTAEVLYDSGQHARQHVGELHAGEVFGEMGLLTGEPRSATVMATSDCFCYKLDRDGFTNALEQRPALAEEISKLLAQRKLELEATKAGLQANASSTGAEAQGELLRRIRNFFHLE
jgi:small-conductance mechanosensitive channel/CRP-like cAMP-binding protein